jgi:hypothetical protein
MSRVFFSIPFSELPMSVELLKLAELPEPPPDSGEPPQAARSPDESKSEIKHPILHAVKSVAAPAAAFGAGTMGGYLGQLGVEKAFRLGQPATRPLSRVIAPIAGGLMGLAMQQYKSREQQELRRALEAHKNQSARRLSAE